MLINMTLEQKTVCITLANLLHELAFQSCADIIFRDGWTNTKQHFFVKPGILQP